ncbi:hypothetical protein GCM10022243_52970 [Saccharothrix violaceirubra]|uniref:Fic/DOC N-terminal domain-containing protein n=1 Tax=Saccharothrix violaceirubra TaxID=413306 RepID=A0A7W7SYR6_9PSEU|nr:Fic/DOC family N-terminal domain-containing protein [Saccharothrix violaceirubra]MBB4963359.1 hypothetical protein [Saccharothrix violaceirubra]
MCSPATYSVLAEAEHALGRLDEAAERLPGRHWFVRSTRVRDAVCSAHLSGLPVGLREAFAADLVAGQGPPPVDRYGPTRALAPYLAVPDGVDEPLTPDVPRLEAIASAHYRREVLRPFRAQEAHRARAASMRQLVDAGLLRDEVLPLSLALEEDTPEYRRQLHRVVETGEVEQWLRFFAEAVRDQALAQVRLIGRTLELIDEYARRVRRAGTLAEVAVDLAGFPVVNHRALVDRYEVSPKTATNLTRQMVELGMLVQWGGGSTYRRIYVCEDALGLVSQESPDLW